MAGNEFQTNDDFDEKLLDVDKTPQEVIDRENAFNQERDSILGVEKPDNTDQPWQLSKEEFDAIVQKANAFDTYKAEVNQKFNKLFGTTGQLQHEFKTVKQQPAGQPQPLTKERFAKLTEYYGDEALAEALAEDLGSLTIQGQSSPFDAEKFNADIETKWSERESALKKELHKDLLTAIHPDWRDVTFKKGEDGNALTHENGTPVHSDEFAEWLTKLPSDEARVKALSANDAPTLIKVLTEFKTWAGKKSDFEAKKRERLADAIPIKEGISGRNQNQSSSVFQQELQ